MLRGLGDEIGMRQGHRQESLRHTFFVSVFPMPVRLILLINTRIQVVQHCPDNCDDVVLLVAVDTKNGNVVFFFS